MGTTNSGWSYVALRKRAHLYIDGAAVCGDRGWALRPFMADAPVDCCKECVRRSNLLVACECDNTHASAGTVCQWCWANGRRLPTDPDVSFPKQRAARHTT